MPINVVTGLPRQGKTLWTICSVKARAEREKRPVFYCNIPGVTIEGWTEIDHPDKWMEVPDGSIIIVDELQDFWGKNSPGQKVPTPILELSKHGKRGIDFYFITQSPSLVHGTPLTLCQDHYYVVRAWGTHKALVYKFQRYRTNERVATKEKGVEVEAFMYPKEAFNWYKSADTHNIKRKLPMKVVALPFLVLLSIAALFFAGKTVLSIGGNALQGAVPTDSAPVPGAGAGGQMPGTAQALAQRRQAQPMTAQEYVQNYTARIPDLPHTAPAYDELTKPKQAPYPAACISSRTRCNCYTQQATPLQISDRLCRDIVRAGFYVAWLDPQTGQQHVTASNQVNQAQQPAAPAVIQPATVALRF